MDGNGLIRKLAGLLQETYGVSAFLDDKLSYDYLYEAAIEVARRTKALTNSTTITTVAGQTNYDLPNDYLALMVSDSFNYPVAKYNNGSANTWVRWRPYDAILFGDQTQNVPIPNSFSVTDKLTPASRITGTASSAGAASGGECTLSDSTAPFANVSAGDEVHNVTDGSFGVVVSVTSTSALVTALFGGSGNDWTMSDAYVVVPQGRLQLVLDPPPDTTGDTVTLFYYAKPAPVYSAYRTYRFPESFAGPIVKYASWLYKYRDRNPQMGDALYQHFEMDMRKIVRESGANRDRYSIRVNFNRRSLGDRAYR